MASRRGKHGDSMKPVKVWYLGILPLTRRAYLRLLVWVVAVVVIMFMLFYTFRPDLAPPFHWPWAPRDPRLQTTAELFFFHYFYTFVAVCVIAEIVDVAIMMKKYAAKEREAKARRSLKNGLDD